jgi:hypothetical protein
MTRDLDLLTLVLLDPCLTADEAAREAAARAHTATLANALRGKLDGRRRREARDPSREHAADGPAVGF